MEHEKAVISSLPRVTAEIIQKLEARLNRAAEAGTIEHEALAVRELLRTENHHLYQLLNHEFNRLTAEGFHIGVPWAAMLTYEALRMESQRKLSAGDS